MEKNKRLFLPFPHLARELGIKPRALYTLGKVFTTISPAQKTVFESQRAHI
jgi:hypothetical protein